GARAERPVPRCAAVLGGGAPPRHEGRAEDVPPRDDRAVPRPPGRGEGVVHARARAEPAVLAALDAGRAEGGDVKRLVVVIGLAAALLAPVAAQAHPLGNFTINRFSRIEVSGPRVYVFYVLDMAEIPTFQAGKIDAAAYARRIAANAHLTVGGQPVRLVPL